MAAKRKSGASRGRKKSRKQSPPLVWAIGGLALGLLVALLVWINANSSNAPYPPEVATSQPAAPRVPEIKTVVRPAPKPIEIPQPEKSRFEFYQALKDQKVIIPRSNSYNTQSSTGPLLLPSKPADPANSGKQAYILQAGSFKKHQQADEMKARLALLGIAAKIEKVRVSDGIWHRVRLGPFKSIDEANRIRTQLHAQKIKSLLVKVH
jgi:cell division protein FtsN